MITASNATLRHIQERNKIFFSKESTEFHGDKKYGIVKENGKTYLKVNHMRGTAYYEIEEMTLSLNYTKLIEENI